MELEVQQQPTHAQGFAKLLPCLLWARICAATCALFTAFVDQQVSKHCYAACAGGARAVATRATGYEVDATEYGEHWNFYLTLGFVFLLNAIACIPKRLLLPVGGPQVPSLQQLLSCKAQRVLVCKPVSRGLHATVQHQYY